jgi:hypothetical protein
MQKTKLKIPVQLIAELNYSPSMKTYFKLKLHNKSGHYKHISTKYKQIAIDLKISESSLRKHVNLLQENGFVRLEKNKLVLVSIWRNPIINKDRKHTAAHYQQITKVKIDPTQLKLEMAKIKLLTQLKRQKYKAKKSAKKIFKKDSVKNKAKELVSELAQNGEFKNIRERIYADDSIINKEQEIDNIIGGIKLVSIAVAAYKQSHEGKAIAKSQSISQTRIAELLGVKSTNTVRKKT